MNLEKICRTVANMTEHNQHGEALEYIAKEFNETDFLAVFEEINKQHDKLRCISLDLQTVRNGIAKRMLNKIYKIHGSHVFNELQNAL